VTEQALRFGAQISGNVTALHVTPEKDYETLRNLWVEHVEGPSKTSGLMPPRLEIVYSPFGQLFQPILAFIDRAKEDPARFFSQHRHWASRSCGNRHCQRCLAAKS
jgi:hypothetical protein